MRPSWFIELIGAVILSACTAFETVNEAESTVFDKDGFEMPFSLSVGGSVVGTKMTAEITQADGTNENPSFRGINRIYAIPFSAPRSVVSSDTRNGLNLELPHVGILSSFGPSALNGDYEGLVSGNNSHLYKSVYIRRGTASMLVYGQAIDEAVSVSPDSVAFKRRNGVLRKHGVEAAEKPADISFTLEPFITESVETEINGVVNGLCTYLGNIAAAEVTKRGYARRATSQTTWTYTWSNFASYGNHATLTNAFGFLTGDGIAFSAGSDGISGMLTTLYNDLYDIANSTSESSDYKQEYYGYNSYNSSGDYYYVYELAREIRSLINQSTYVTVTNGNTNSATVTLKDPYSNFPDKYGVPPGCVSIKWNGSFVRLTPAMGAALAPTNTYCYPPSLWYKANSTLRTSDTDDVVAQYVSTNTTWASICARYTYGTSVVPGVLSAALKDPLQYGVAMLKVDMNFAESVGGTEFLPDSRANAIDVRNGHFPLTGIIIGEQKNLDFNFRPELGGSSMYIYDSDVNNGSSPKAYIAGYSSGLDFKSIHTLVVQTEDAQDVHMALEFQNNSGAKFYGLDGCVIAPGSKFYLIATLDYDSVTNTGGLSSVFVQDHVTHVTFSVQSLAKAYNTIPELRDPQLEIGVTADMEWIQVTPSEVPMY